MNRYQARIFLICGIVILLSSLVWADEDDPPARVARMNYAQGSVSFQPGGEGDWVEAVPNRPLTTGDNLWTDRDSRAELHTGSTAIRLGSETSLTFLELDDRTLQLRLAQGSALLRVRHIDDEDTIEIDAPNLAFRILRNGEYRVDVNADGHTTIVDVFQGRGEAIGGGNNYTVVADQQAVFSGDDELSYDIDPLPASDGFDQWAFGRDRREDEDRSANYVSREMTGYEDLDEHGRWSYAANYGPVWVPTGVPAGWAPYRFGHWVWVAPWGWTWVDDQPWGFAPFHYGRWCMVGGGWAWVPGPVVVRPVYAPALVAFVGGGGFHFSVSFGGGGGGGVAWFPLAPGEVFVPAYHVSRTYVNQVNVTNTVVNVTKVTNVYNYYTTNNTTNVERITYVNRTAPNAVTAVSHETFVNARPVARNTVVIPQRELEQAPVSHTSSVEPMRTSVIGAGRPTSVAPPPAVANRLVVAQRPPAPPTQPFNQRHDPLVARPGRPVAEPIGSRNETNRPGTEPKPHPNPPVVYPERGLPHPGVEPVRPEVARPEVPRLEAPRNEDRMRQGPRNNEQPPQQPPGWSHPLARPVPPVREKTPQQAQQEENKQRRWEQRPQPERKGQPEHDKPHQ
jgi:hypothetical protein